MEASDTIKLLEERLAQAEARLVDHAKLEAAARDSEERLRGVLDGMAEGFGVIGPDFTILEHNQEALRMDGRRREEIVGRSHWDAFPGTEHSEVGRVLKKVMADRQPTTLEHRYSWENDRALWLELRVYPTANGCLAVFWRDITGRKAVEATLLEREQKYRTLFDSIDEGFAIFEMIYNASGEAVDFRYVETNPAFERQTGRRPTPGQTMRELFPEAEDMWLADYAEVARTGRSKRFVDRVEGMNRWYDVYVFPVTGQPGQLAAVFRDVTDNKRAEEASRESEERHAFLVRFSDAVRGLSDPAEVATTACHMLLERMDVDRAHWAEIDWNTKEFVIIGSVHSPGVAPIMGRFPLASWEPYAASHRAGHPVVVNDTQTDERANRDMRAAAASMHIGADLAAPVLVNGHLACVLAVKRRQPHRWTGEEIRLIESVAARCWAEVERARAAAALRESDERQAFLLKLSDAVRPLAGPAEIQGEATRLLREQLNAAWCYYVDWDPARKVGWVLRDSVRESVPSLTGAHDVSDAPEFLELLASGSVQAVRDYAGYEQLPARIRQKFTVLGFRSMMAAPLVKKGRLIATLIIGDTEVRDWSTGETAALVEVAERTWSAIERGYAEVALRDSEARFQQFGNASRSALWVRNSETFDFEYVSPSVMDVYGVAPEDLMGDERLLGATILPEDREQVSERVRRIGNGETIVQEYRIFHTRDRSFRWVRSTGFPLYDENGKVERIGGIAEDVTDTKSAVEHQGVLLSELQHRVRNIMAIIRSTVVRSAAGATSVEDYKTSLANRLLALARVQTLLTREANAGGSLREILESEIGAQAHSENQYELTGPDTTLSPKAIEVLTLAFHELSTNALKYGALSVQGGKITVTWTLFEKQDKPWLAIDWVEEGAPPRPPPTRRGFGSELIEGKIPYELRGTGKMTVGPDGARCHIEFPVREAESILETDAPAPTRLYGGSVDMTGAPDLTGKTILVVEDDFYAASDTAAALRGAGAEVQGPCPTQEEALFVIDEEEPTAAVLDLNLGGGGPRFELAYNLLKRGTPFIFLTGYDNDVIPDELADIPRLQKPVALRDIVEAVSKLKEERNHS